MLEIFKKHPKASILSLVFHLLLVVFFIFGADFSDDELKTKPALNIVKATVIDESKIKAEAEKLKSIDRQKKLQEKKQLDELKKKRLDEEKKLADLRKQQELKKKEIEQQELAKKKQDEAAKLKKLDDAKKKQQLEKDKAAQDKVAQDKAAQEKIRKDKAEKEKVAREKAQKDKAIKEKAAKEKVARENAAKEQAQRERALREMAEQEELEMRAQEAIGSFTDLIRAKVGRNWIEPLGDISGLSCVVRVRLIPGGEVLDAQVIKSSGNTFFDRSVELATKKASPLPLPSDPSMFSYFRTLEFYFKPGG
ncbi:MAG: colicin import membrane protein [Cycloclasticus sp.]|jgi:colicin import membrane protein